MKRTLLVIAVILFTSSTAFSQFKFGMGVSLGTESGVDNFFDDQKMYPGINFRGSIEFPIIFGVQGGITYFLPTTFTSGPAQDFTISNMQANIDLVYYFVKFDKLKAYAFGGPTLSYLKVKRKGNITGDAKSEYYEPSFELGAGVTVGKFYGEIKYDFSKMNHYYEFNDYEVRGSQFIGSFGIYF